MEFGYLEDWASSDEILKAKTSLVIVAQVRCAIGDFLTFATVKPEKQFCTHSSKGQGAISPVGAP
jgi:hypothetical protein